MLTIGAIAKCFGVSDNTIRRMETAGLLTPAIVRPSGIRLYDRENIFKIKMILSLKAFGLINEDIRKFFKNPGDFSPIYDKLFERKLILDVLLNRTKLFIRSQDPNEVIVISHDEIPYYYKSFPVDGQIRMDMLDKLVSDVFLDAVRGQYPIDYSRPITIQTTCMDYLTFDPDARQVLTLCVPLSRKCTGPNTGSIPAQSIASFTWYPGMTFQNVLGRFKKYMDDHQLTQIAPLAATFEIGGHVSREIDISDYLLHIIIPFGKKEEK